MWDVTKATLVVKIMYASQVWWGFASSSEKMRLQAILNKATKLKYLQPNFTNLSDLCETADETLFRNILHNPNHVLYSLLPPVKNTGHELRERAHDRQLPSVKDAKDTLLKKTFIHRMLYKDSY